MRFNIKLLALIASAAPAAYAAVGDACYLSPSKPGACINTAECSRHGGTYRSGLCPNDPANVKCCFVQKVMTLPNGKHRKGTCRNVWDCNSNRVPGYCPGPSTVQLCVPDTDMYDF